jgi:hypothetical protein
VNRQLSDDQLRDKALDVLTEHLGPTQTIRFLSWLRSKPRDYQTWRYAHFKDLDVDELIAQMREMESRQQGTLP